MALPCFPRVLCRTRCVSCSRNLHIQIVRRSVNLERSHYYSQRPRRTNEDESTLASAKHQPSLSGPSLGHLLSELSPTTPEMLRSGQRREGHTMNEEHRTLARKVTVGIIGLPLAFGSLIIGGVWLWREHETE